MTRKNFPVLAFFLFLWVLLVSPARPAHSAVITVTSKLDSADPGKCRLRDAIIAANTNSPTGDCPAGTAGVDTIGFSLGVTCNVTPCTITLNSALPSVTEGLVVNGNNTIISGANAFRVFALGPVTVDISNLRIANGNTSGDGAAILMSNDAAGTTLTVTNVFFSNNHAAIGGAIYAPRGTLNVVGSNFSGNTATFGGAIGDESSATLTVSDSIFSSNTSVIDGGSLVLAGGAIISTSSFTGNTAGFGSAISKFGSGNLFVSDSVFANNTATSTSTAADGGAIYLSTSGSTMATMTNVTISGTSSKNFGGGIAVNLLTLNLNNVTIANNTAESDNNGIGDGGGIARLSGTVNIQNSIVADNFDTPGNGGNGIIAPDCSGTFSSRGYNLIGRSNGCSGFFNGVSGDIVGTSASLIFPLLGPLADNGGSTQTHALLAGSPALNAGNPLLPGSGGLACAGFDQRGVVRPQAGLCDIGAFELEGLKSYLPLVFG